MKIKKELNVAPTCNVTSKKGGKQIIDNRILTSVQRRIINNIQRQEVVNENKSSANLFQNVVQGMFSPPKTRSGNKPFSTDTFDPMGRTRASRTQVVPLRPTIPLVTDPAYWSAASPRPNFIKSTVDEIYESGKVSVDSNGVQLYSCITKDGMEPLPKKGDFDKYPTSYRDYASIGHKVQWEEYIASQCDTEEIRVTGGKCFAYKVADVKAHYSDKENLELESQAYNSSIAHHHRGDSPLAPVWV